MIERTDKNDITVLKIEGRLDTVTSIDAGKIFDSIVDEGRNKIILDMSGSSYVSSSGIRIIVKLLQALNKVNGKLTLAALQPFVEEVFRTTGLDKLNLIYPDLESAEEALKQVQE